MAGLAWVRMAGIEGLAMVMVVRTMTMMTVEVEVVLVVLLAVGVVLTVVLSAVLTLVPTVATVRVVWMVTVPAPPTTSSIASVCDHTAAQCGYYKRCADAPPGYQRELTVCGVASASSRPRRGRGADDEYGRTRVCTECGQPPLAPLALMALMTLMALMAPLVALAVPLAVVAPRLVVMIGMAVALVMVMVPVDASPIWAPLEARSCPPNAATLSITTAHCAASPHCTPARPSAPRRTRA